MTFIFRDYYVRKLNWKRPCFCTHPYNSFRLKNEGITPNNLILFTIRDISVMIVFPLKIKEQLR